MFKFLMMILMITFTMSPAFAKGQAKKVSSLGFDKRVYYKLSFQERLKYLKAYVDFVVAMEKEGKKIAFHSDEKSVDEILSELLIPKAFAATTSCVAAKTCCLTGGIYYAPPCGALPGSMTSGGVDVVYSCGVQNRCAIFFGVGSDGKGHCWSSEGSATTQCAGKSSDASIAELNKRLSACKMNQSAYTECKSYMALMASDLENNPYIKEACVDRSSKRGACAKLAAAVSKATGIADGAITEKPGTPNIKGEGCSTVETALLNGTGGDDSKKHAGWYELLKTAGLGCPQSSVPDMKTIMARAGVCQVSATTPQHNVMDELRHPSRSNALDVFNKLQDPRNLGVVDMDANRAGWNSFADIFGLTPGEFKKVFCDSTTATDFHKALKELPDTPPSGAAVASERRKVLKACNEQTHQPSSSDPGRLVSNFDPSCRFKPAPAMSFDSLKSATANDFNNKYYFQDNVNGACYTLEKAVGSDACKSIGTPIERNASGITCPTTTGMPGTAVTSGGGYARLDNAIENDSMDRIIPEADVASKFTIYQWDCGAPGNPFSNIGIDTEN